MNGGLEQITTILCDPCLAECIEALGDHADNPTEEQLKEVTPALVDKWGVPTVRMMIAGSIAGEAAASVMLTRLLKSDEELALPPEAPRETVVLPPRTPTTSSRPSAAPPRKPSRPRPGPAASSKPAPSTAPDAPPLVRAHAQQPVAVAVDPSPSRWSGGSEQRVAARGRGARPWCRGRRRSR